MCASFQKRGLFPCRGCVFLEDANTMQKQLTSSTDVCSSSASCKGNEHHHRVKPSSHDSLAKIREGSSKKLQLRLSKRVVSEKNTGEVLLVFKLSFLLTGKESASSQMKNRKLSDPYCGIPPLYIGIFLSAVVQRF